MPDITFDDLIRAKEATQPTQQKGDGGFLSGMTQESMLQMGTMALEILDKVKGIQSGGGVVASRPAAQQTQSQQEAEKPMVDITQVKEALNMVKMAKGDITISSMLKLIDENKEAVAGLLKQV